MQAITQVVKWALGLGFFLASTAALTQGGLVSVSTQEAPLALRGYSPVSYFEVGRPERGLEQFSAVYQNRTYYFVDQAQLQTFKNDPEAYAPIFPEHCPYNLAMGREQPVDPVNYKIVGGQLLLFHSASNPNNDGLVQWNRTVRSRDFTEQEMIERARSNLIELTF